MIIWLTIITVYLAGAAYAAPRLMRLIYQDRLAQLTQTRAEREAQLAAYKRGEAPRPSFYYGHTEGDLMRDAREMGFWWALVWPASLAFWQLGNTAFKQEIAAAQAQKNQRIIADYDRLLHQRFDDELHTHHPTKTGILKIRNTLKEKK